MAGQFDLPKDDKKAILARRLAEAKTRTKEIEARPELDRPRRDIDWKDVGKSAATGLRSGLESTAGSIGDIGGLQAAATSYGAEKLGLSPETAATIGKYTNPMSLFANTEQVREASDKVLGRDAITRHTSTSPQGQNIATASEFLSGLVGGPENLGKDVALKLGMSLIPAAKLAGKGIKKVGREALTEAVAEPALRKVDATVGDLQNAPALFEGVDPRSFTSTEQWHRFGQEHGVPNLGSASEADWQASLMPFQTSKGVDFTVPGGVGSKDPFTYFDLLHLKQQGINPNDIPPELHQGIHDRMLATMSPEGEVTPERMMNQLLLAQISPNQPLTPNELAVARTMVKGPEDIKRLADMVPWRYSDDPAKSGASDIVSTKQVIDKKTGLPKDVHTTRRQQTSTDIANRLGLGAGATGGLGARGTADYTRIAETAQRLQDDPEFFRFRGAGEGGGTEPHDPRNWSNFVERLANQTPGLSSKTGSFGAVWQNPAQANISAVDRHMASKFTAEMFPSAAEYEAFKTQAVDRFRKANKDAGPITFEALPQSFKNDQMFGYLNANPSMKYRGQPAKGSNSGEGPVNPRVPEHLQPDQAQWVHEPKDVELISEPYQRVLEANAAEANKAGQSIFGSQWMLWDRIRNRLEPHEIMFPGLEKLPRMSMDQMQAARADLSGAGYMSGTKTVDPVTGEPTGLQPVRKLPSASRAAYFELGGGAAGGAAMLQMLKEREREKQGGQT